MLKIMGKKIFTILRCQVVFKTMIGTIIPWTGLYVSLFQNQITLYNESCNNESLMDAER